MRHIEFVPEAFKEYQDWIETDRKLTLRIGDLIRDILRSPFEGIGKPEASICENHLCPSVRSRKT